ncbi:hypothetical protein ABE060_01360 [Bacillus rugosus]|uniref:hypothetical protein n=1 Tax=Bacillus rugosus TaxID=2715209 RepID=UPI0014213793|nr:hypothetical protein [Bacillus rugosus]NUF05594.1 hypothetical protein [Bacillus rugosus]
MKLSLLDNGVDSLKATYNSLEDIKYLLEGVEHKVKDAILSLYHANEILLKLLLQQRAECLAFVDINAFMNAKEEIYKKGENNVFEAKPNLQTIGFTEAVRRLELLCDIEVCSRLKRSLEYLRKKRNQIMHYEIVLSEEEFKALVVKLSNCYEYTIRFFSRHIDNLGSLVEDARFELIEEEPDVEAMYDDTYTDFLAEMGEQ